MPCIIIVLAGIILGGCKLKYDYHNSELISKLSWSAIQMTLETVDSIETDTIIINKYLVFRDSINKGDILLAINENPPSDNIPDGFEDTSNLWVPNDFKYEVLLYNDSMDVYQLDHPIKFCSPLLPTTKKDTFFLQTFEYWDVEIHPYLYRGKYICYYYFTIENKKLEPAGRWMNSYYSNIKAYDYKKLKEEW